MKLQLPLWASGCIAVMLLQSSLEATEWVFSFLSNSFQDTQDSSMEHINIL